MTKLRILNKTLNGFNIIINGEEKAIKTYIIQDILCTKDIQRGEYILDKTAQEKITLYKL